MEILTREELLEYLKDSKRVRSKKPQAILSILLDNPDGIVRCCLREKLREMELDIGQAAGQIRDLRNAGVNIPPSKREMCEVHGRNDTKDILLSPYITGNHYARAIYSPAQITKIRKILDSRDAFTQIRATTNPEIDHRIPVGRRRAVGQNVETKVDVTNPEEVRNAYQILTRDTNLYKSRLCERCVTEDKKPTVFLGIPIPKSIGGGQPFVEGKNDCTTCPFAFPEKFREHLVYRDSAEN
jgi:hypothetical protein